jgi:hypothetical protein
VNSIHGGWRLAGRRVLLSGIRVMRARASIDISESWCMFGKPCQRGGYLWCFHDMSSTWIGGFQKWYEFHVIT